MTPTNLRKDLLKIVLTALLAFFLLPCGALLFVKHAQNSIDRDFLSTMSEKIANANATMEEKASIEDLYQHNPPSSMCANDDPQFEKYHNAVCDTYSELWQFNIAHITSFWTIIVGIAALAIVVLLGALAFVNRRAQYWSFVFGWRLLILISAAEVIVQGVLSTWLSFWVTAFFFQFYVIKLVAIFGVGAAIAVFAAVVHIFKRAPQGNDLEGEFVREGDAPALWSNIRALAERLQTAPPDQIIAGIDTNFFVTESPLTVNGQAVTGRTLFVSIPLLRIIDQSEANAVLTHELAHLRGGDAASSAALWPKLTQYDHYCRMMHESAVTFLAYYILRLYRVIFEFALKRDSREREFLADRTAAEVVSPMAVVSSLIKVAAYARYRAQVEQSLFEQNQKHGEAVGIAHNLALGLAPYASSEQFQQDMATANVPHPFDSHPLLPERMKNVGAHLDSATYGDVVTTTPEQTWAEHIHTAADIEQRLWANYERQFAAAHEHSLAYRYLPANEQEAEIVLKYFPPLAFALKKEQAFQITYAGLVLPGESDMLSWDQIVNMTYKDGYGGDVLTLQHPGKTWKGVNTTKVKLPGIKNQRAQFKQALGHYWQRHQIMRKGMAG